MPNPSNKISASWRREAAFGNPAGPLFAGKHAAADIVCETGTTTGKCGTICTGSVTNQCC